MRYKNELKMTHWEDETRSLLESYLSSQSVPHGEIKNYMARLSSSNTTSLSRSAQELQIDEVEEGLEETSLEDQEGVLASQEVDRRKIANDVRTATLGENPKARREQIRSTLPDGFYIGLSGKRGVRTLHRLGACYLLLDVDYGLYIFAGTDMPLKTEFDVVCTLCAKKGLSCHNGSSESQVSSSTSDSELQ